MAHTHDDLGRRTGISRLNGVSSAYGYDGVSRLTSLSHDLAGTTDDVAYTYAYNPAGQIVTKTTSNPAYVFTPTTGTTAYANDGLNRVTTAGGLTVGYDGNQNITGVGAATNGFDAYDRLTSSTGGTYAYDPLGRLASESATTTDWVSERGRLIGEFQSGSAWRYSIPGEYLDETVAQYAGGQPWFSLTDERGSVVAVAGNSGSPYEIIRYDEYGVASTASGAPIWSRFAYTGQVQLYGTPLQHYKARAYDPALGRFVQTDPIGYAAGPNLYAYVGGDPVNFVDPLGLDAFDLGSNSRRRGRNRVCVDPPTWEDTGEKDRFKRAPAPYCSDGGGSVGAGVRGLGGIGIFFGSPSGPDPVTSTPEYARFDAARDRAAEQNRWMAIPALAPVLAVGLAEVGAAGVFARVCNCFEAGTEVTTDQGLMPIEAIKVGDRVLARDDQTGETSYRRVTALIDGEKRAIWEVTIETTDGAGRVLDEVIGTTNEHPWRLADGRWVETDDLRSGMVLIAADGDRAVVKAALLTARAAETYNFEVEDDHTYFVGESGIWVHNACPPLRLLHSADAIRSNFSALNYWGRQSTDDIVRSLAPGSRTPLTVKPNGVVMDGNTRLTVLLSRGYNINSLPRVPY